MTYRERLLIVALEDSIKAQRSLQRALFEYADQSPKDNDAEEKHPTADSIDKITTGQWGSYQVPEIPVGGIQTWPTVAPGPYAPPGTTVYCSGSTQGFSAKVNLHNTSEDTPF